MLRDGMPVDVSDEFDTALHLATWFKQTDVIKHLLQEGADVNRQDHWHKDTPLHFAAQYNNTAQQNCPTLNRQWSRHQH